MPVVVTEDGDQISFFKKYANENVGGTAGGK
jgi:hypothetical protein